MHKEEYFVLQIGFTEHTYTHTTFVHTEKIKEPKYYFYFPFQDVHPFLYSVFLLK